MRNDSDSSGQDYRMQSFPASRQFTMDVGKLGLRKHHIKALIEVDVTDARDKFRQLRADTGEKVSFTAWLLKCIGTALDEHKQVHACRKGRNRLVVFESVDISTMVERKVDDTSVPLPMIIREVNDKQIAEITDEIAQARQQGIESEQDYILGKEKPREPVKLYSLLPRPLRLLLWRIMLSNPHRLKKMMGTSIVTSVGMMGSVNGWFIPYGIHPVCFAVGSIVEKPGVVDGTVAIREFLPITILIDHDVVDGAPAARFVSHLTSLMEKGAEL